MNTNLHWEGPQQAEQNWKIFSSNYFFIFPFFYLFISVFSLSFPVEMPFLANIDFQWRNELFLALRTFTILRGFGFFLLLLGFLLLHQSSSSVLLKSLFVRKFGGILGERSSTVIIIVFNTFKLSPGQLWNNDIVMMIFKYLLKDEWSPTFDYLCNNPLFRSLCHIFGSA